MKATTLNFWCGVFIGAGVTKFGSKWIKGFKKGFVKGLENGLGLTSPSEYTKNIGEEVLSAARSYSSDDADSGRDSDTTWSETSVESVSEVQETYEKLAAGYGCDPSEIKTATADDGTTFIIFPSNVEAIDPSHVTTGTIDSEKMNADPNDEFSDLDS